MIPLIECVPNISEGRDLHKIKTIAAEVETVEGVQLLEVDPGRGANRTVITFVGPPEQVIEAAFRLIKKAAELIDMRFQKGEHPRIGATDVCPLIPISGITAKELIPFAHQLGERVGRELNIPGYFYEDAALQLERRNLAICRKGEYEGLDKLSTPDGKPDFGPDEFNDKVKKTGATVIGVRNFLIAYNINLNTTSVSLAKEIAADIRESGRMQKALGIPVDNIDRDNAPRPIRIPGSLKAVKGIGWFIEEYGIAQVSLNITNIHITPVHIAFEEVRKKATERGLRVTGSELVGLIPLQCLTEAADFYLALQNSNTNISEEEKVKIAIKSLGLDDLAPFDPYKKVLEYVMKEKSNKPFLNLTLKTFADKVASRSYLPAGGSASAYCGALGISLGIMSANVSAHKKNWDHRSGYFLELASKGYAIRDQLMEWVDRDTLAYQKILDAFALPKSTEMEISNRNNAVQLAYKEATVAPLKIAEIALQAFPLIRQLVDDVNKASVTDAAVGAVLISATVRAAAMNIKINLKTINDNNFTKNMLHRAEQVEEEALKSEKEILEMVSKRLET